MVEQQNFEPELPVAADPAVALAKALGQWPKAPPAKPKTFSPKTFSGNTHAKTGPSVESLVKEIGLKLGDQNELTIRRVKRGKSYSFVRANGSHIRDSRTIRRLHSMAVPPAYAEVRYSPDPNSRAGCNTAITPIGKRSGSTARPTAWRGWWRRCQKSGVTSLSTCRASCLPASLHLRP
jgi:hypothetical protein